MMQYSLLDRRPEESILNLLQENNIGVLTRGSMAQGHLINKPASTYLNHTAEELKAFQKEFHAITDSNLHRIQWSLQYVLNQPVVKSAVTGIRTQDQLEQVIRYKDLNISKDEIQKLIQLINPLTYQLHR